MTKGGKMIHLLQLYKMVQDKKLFIGVFSDFKEECDYMDYPEECVPEFFNEMLLNHFGLEVECDNQLLKITNCILKKDNLNFLAYL